MNGLALTPQFYDRFGVAEGDRAPSIINPANYDTIPDALAAVTSSAGEIVFGAGTFVLDLQAISELDGLVIRGAGVGRTIIKRGATLASAMFNLNGLNQTIRDLTIDGNGLLNTAGNQCELSLFGDGPGTLVQNVEIRNVRSRGIDVYKSARILDCIVTGLSNASIPSMGIWMDAPSVLDVKIRGCLISGHGINGIYAGGRKIRIIGNTIRSNHWQTTPTGGGQIDLQSDNAAVADIIISANDISDGGGLVTCGIEIDGGNAVISGNLISGNKGGGILVQSTAVRPLITGNEIKNNGNGGTEPGISVPAGGSYFQIVGNHVYDDQVTKTQMYGISVPVGASDHYVIANNLCHGNGTSQLSDLGTGSNKSVANNVTT